MSATIDSQNGVPGFPAWLGAIGKRVSIEQAGSDLVASAKGSGRVVDSSVLSSISNNVSPATCC